MTAQSTSFEVQVEALREQLIAWRRDFHRHPELSLQEYRSAEVIAGCLRELGYRIQTGVAGTGVVALLVGDRPGPVVMLRFDMDALPMAEKSGASYASENPGVMHACGHDGHMAIGLGVATLAAGCRSQLAGTLKLVFQPAEEALGGAQRMLLVGVLDDPRPDFLLAAHIWNELPLGTIGVTPGPVMAACDTWSCIVHGRGGHGAMPYRAVDPVVAAAQIIVALQTVVSRNVSPLEAAVVTVSIVRGGSAVNIIPDQVELEGTIRSFQPEVRELVLRRVQEVVEGVARACGASAEVEFKPSVPAVVNDARVADVVRQAAAVVVGPENVLSSMRAMGSEDAAFFLQQVPGCYFFLGSANPSRGLDAPHHNPHFDFDESVLPIGVLVLMHALTHYIIIP